MLYPYRASAQKNQMRWQFGVLAPRAYAEATGSERVDVPDRVRRRPGRRPARLTVRVRCLQVQRRTMEAPSPGAGVRRASPSSTSTASASCRGRRRSSTSSTSPTSRCSPSPTSNGPSTATSPAPTRSRSCAPPTGEVVGRVPPAVRAGRRGRARARRLGRHAWACYIKVAVEVENVTGWSEPDAPRDVADAPLARRGAHAARGRRRRRSSRCSTRPTTRAVRSAAARARARSRCSSATTTPSCSRHRSSSTTTPKSRPRATARSTTRPRSTRSSRSGCSR